MTLLLGLAFASAALTARAQTEAPASCKDCHAADSSEPVRGAPLSVLAQSVHASLDCTACHESISMEALNLDSSAPHGASVPAVQCGECHEDQEELYVSHGKLNVGDDPDVPGCTDCHGTHDIFVATDKRARTHQFNLPDTCLTCHLDTELVARHDGLRAAPLRMYNSSVHGRAAGKGVHTAASCIDCHSGQTQDGKRTAHRILSAMDRESTIYHFTIPDTCGRCHVATSKNYWEGIHGKAVKRGSSDAPVCTHCHGTHNIIKTSDPNSPVSSSRLAESTCAPCHESAVLAERYGIEAGRLTSYIDSYHGLKSKTGDATVANCASCHGAHRILPSTDPSSSIHPSNLRATCGECHPGKSEQLALMRVHETATGMRTGWPDLFRRVYLVLIVVVVGGMLLHNAADWLRRVKQIRGLPAVQRLTGNEVAQHWILVVSFTVLVVTGFSLRFSEAGWVKLLFGWKGGFELRGFLHRTAAVLLMTGTLWHALYLIGHRGRNWFKDMLPTWDDFRHMRDNVWFFIGKRSESPRFKRFSYMEKLEYWSLCWGMVIMALTGLILWFDDYFVAQWSVPEILLDVGVVIHYYEAWLAFLAITVWHIYGTVLSPSVYPMNTAWLSGKMSKEAYSHEHPEGPKLRARTWTCHFEVEDDEYENQAKPE